LTREQAIDLLTAVGICGATGEDTMLFHGTVLVLPEKNMDATDC